MPRNNLGISDELLIDALEIAQKQRTRMSATFKPGSAARAEIEGEAGQLAMAMNTLKAGGAQMNIEDKINEKRK